ncbi:replication stress response regulator SDE2 isoform X2 [Simochromis diagramma]|uniref:replication stress response regulator SDE2 isoform X2 n=1 Tax=Simochromis diagramma TaxID=43689 RepID=UPI001A7E8D23|nr:replication stress response regulator SDE2 isoform X2 [Simochromis diagramma]
MEVSVSALGRRGSTCVFPVGSVVRHVLDRLVPLPEDFYVTRDGRRAHLDDPLEHGAVYHLELRLLGGKGGFGSMLRALGAQIEKTTNREACRDLSGRRLRDVNHEKEMADWLKKQAEREAEKEQRRLERLQRKLNEPKHQFTDAEYQQQCHDLSERLEDSVLRGLQASSSSQVKVDDMCGAKRLNCDQSEQPAKKKTKTAGGGGCFWTGLEEMDELMSSDDDEAPSTSSGETAAAVVTMTTRREAAESEEGSSGSTRTTQIPRETSRDQTETPSEDRDPEETSRDQTGTPSVDRDPEETSRDQTGTPSEDRDPEETSRDQTETPSEDQNHPGPSKPSQSSGPSQQLDLLSASSVEQLESLGLDVLKKELMSRGLKCGGTLSERAARLFAIRGQSADEIDPLLLAKPTKPKKKK